MLEGYTELLCLTKVLQAKMKINTQFWVIWGPCFNKSTAGQAENKSLPGDYRTGLCKKSILFIINQVFFHYHIVDYFNGLVKINILSEISKPLLIPFRLVLINRSNPGAVFRQGIYIHFLR